MEKIIIIEDDEIIREELQNFLKKQGYEAVSTTDFNHVVEFILNEKSNLVLLDLNLPIFDGYYICREVRKESDVPIIVVTSRDSDIDELMSMNLGADDFVTKPYNTQILLARINALLKRSGGSNTPSNLLTYKDLQLNLSNATVQYHEKKLDLTKNELKILSYLITHKGELVSRDLLIEHLWDADYFVDDSTLTVNMARLRKKLEEIGMEKMIETRRGLGYMIP